MVSTSALGVGDDANQSAGFEGVEKRGDVGPELALGRVIIPRERKRYLLRASRRVKQLPDVRPNFVQRINRFEVADVAGDRHDDRFRSDPARDKRSGPVTATRK